jgi:hypothetical protein
MSENSNLELDNIIDPNPMFTDEELELLSKTEQEKNTDTDADDGQNPPEEPPTPQIEEGEEPTPEPPVEGGTPAPQAEDSGKTDDKPLSPVEEYYNYLLEKGVITPPEDFKFDGTEEALEEIFEVSESFKQQMAVQEFLESLPPDYAEAIVYAARTGQPLNAYLESNNTIDFSQVDITDTATQKEVIRSYYKIQNPNFSDEKIDKFISRLQDEDLEGEAEEAIDYLAGYQQQLAEAQRMQQEQLAQQAQEQYVEYQTSVNSAIDQSDFIKGRRKNQLKAFVWNEIERGDGVDTDVNRKIQQLAANPDHYVTFLDLLYDYNPEQGFNFNKIIEQGKAQATTSFRRSLADRLNSARTTVANRKPIDPNQNAQQEN